ncbi:MAG: hypothetical protein HYV09_18980 [Deltaproteobacteria bacterium]|nr:hypothetical protein [Deltaproteobacteria bacterium]
MLALSAAKPLVLGLTKLPTLLSMLVAMGVCWTAYGWSFAVGLIAAIYVHEIGHVVALRRLGIAATSPMFVPGFGAFVRLRQYPADAREDARVGLAGPRYGCVASLAAAGLGLVLASPFLLAIARASAWLNLFNLLPLGSLDGGRGFRALDRRSRVLALAVLVVAWALTKESLVAILAIVALLRLAGAAPAQGDRRAAVEYTALIAVLSALTLLQVPGLPR